MAIQAVLFDLDDTLLWDDKSVEEAFRSTCEEAVRIHPRLDAAKLEASVRKEARALYESYDTIAFTKMIGINPFEALWANFTDGTHESFRLLQKLAPGYRKEAWLRGLQAEGIEDSSLAAALAERFPQERRSRPLVYEETFVVLDSLKRKYKLLLLTNGAPDLQKEKIAGFPQLAAYFDHIIISGEFGEGKPADTIFRHAIGFLGIEPAEGLMVGDKLTTDILGSNRIGMRNAWINRNGLTRTDEIVPTYEIKSLTELQSIIDSIE